MLAFSEDVRAALKVELKQWERDFQNVHGRKPTSADIAADPHDTATKYKKYDTLKKAALRADTVRQMRKRKRAQLHTLVCSTQHRVETNAEIPAEQPHSPAIHCVTPVSAASARSGESASAPMCELKAPSSPTRPRRRIVAPSRVSSSKLSRKYSQAQESETKSEKHNRGAETFSGGGATTLRHPDDDAEDAGAHGRFDMGEVGEIDAQSALDETFVEYDEDAEYGALSAEAVVISETEDHGTMHRSSAHVGSRISEREKISGVSAMKGDECQAVPSDHVPMPSQCSPQVHDDGTCTSIEDEPRDQHRIAADPSTASQTPAGGAGVHTGHSSDTSTATSLGDTARVDPTPPTPPAAQPIWDDALGHLKADGKRRPRTRKPTATNDGPVVSNNFRRQYLQRAGGGYRRGARAKFSRAFKQSHHRNAVARASTCFTCGEPGHYANACPSIAGGEPDDVTEAPPPAPVDTPTQVDAPERQSSEEDYATWTVVRLRAALKAQGLSMTGRKQDLVARMTDADSAREVGADSVVTPTYASAADGRETAPDSLTVFSFPGNARDDSAGKETGVNSSSTHLPNNDAGVAVAVADQEGVSDDAMDDVMEDSELCDALAAFEAEGRISSTDGGVGPGQASTQAAGRTSGTVPPQATGTGLDRVAENVPYLEEKLRELTGHATFRPKQLEAIQRVLRGASTLVVLPTGSGKSLCYQLPAYVAGCQRAGLVLVITPLVSLIDDQIVNLPRQLKGATINSSMTPRQRDKVWDNLASTHVLFIAPETATSASFLFKLQRARVHVPFACVDEVHCVSEWSHNFRTSYLRLPMVLRTKLGVRCILGLTATATLQTETSVSAHLGIPTDGVLRLTPMPRNLMLSVARPADRKEELLHLLKYHHHFAHGAAIVYCMRQADTENLAAFLRANQLDADCYHAGLTPAERRRVQTRFMRDHVRIIVATIAFGMGLNKPNVRCVVHFHMPKSAENYVQEVGRAGRDGHKAYARVLLNDEDLTVLCRHTHSDSVDRLTVQKLLRSIFKPPSSATAWIAKARASMKRSVGGADLIDCAERTSHRYVLLPIRQTEVDLDVRETVISTILSALEIDDEHYIEQGWQCAALCSLTVFNAAHAHKDSVLAAALCGQRAAGGGSATVDVHTESLANAVGMSPQRVLRSLREMQSARLLRVEFKHPALCVSIRKDLIVDGARFDTIHDKICTTLESLETNQLAKLDFLSKAFQCACDDASDKRATSSDTSVAVTNSDESVAAADGHANAEPMTRTERTSAVLRAALEKYFVGEVPLQALSLPVSASMETRVRADALQLLGSMPSKELPTARALARIFHGIPSPKYPAYMWMSNRMWGRHTTVDFNGLRTILADVRRQYRGQY